MTILQNLLSIFEMLYILSKNWACILFIFPYIGLMNIYQLRESRRWIDL